MSIFCCPYCGHKELTATTETNTTSTGKNFSGGKGCLGYLLLGPIGVLCGACGKGQQVTTTNATYWICPKCGKKFRAPDELKSEIEAMDSLPVASIAVCAIFCLIMLIVFASADLFIVGLILAAIVAGLMYMSISASKKEVDVVKKELEEIESGMKKHIELE